MIERVECEQCDHWIPCSIHWRLESSHTFLWMREKKNCDLQKKWQEKWIQVRRKYVKSRGNGFQPTKKTLLESRFSRDGEQCSANKLNDAFIPQVLPLPAGKQLTVDCVENIDWPSPPPPHCHQFRLHDECLKFSAKYQEIYWCHSSVNSNSRILVCVSRFLLMLIIIMAIYFEFRLNFIPGVCTYGV